MSSLDLLIAGAQKAGTSSFLRYLAQHPEICTHQQSEMNYFVNELEFSNGLSTAMHRYFPYANANKVLVAKSVGILDSPIFMQRVYQHNPKITIVILLRHPVDRAYSSYWFARRKGWETLTSFEAAIEADPVRFSGNTLRERECAYLARGIYVKQIEQLLEIFAAEQIRIFLLEDIRQDVINVCKTVYEACNLDTNFVPEINQRHNIATLARSDSLAYLMSSAKPIKKAFRRLLPATTTDKIKYRLQKWNQKQVQLPTMDSYTREKLLAFYSPYNQALSDLLNRDLSHWNK